MEKHNKKNTTHYLCVYCGASQNIQSAYHQAAIDLGFLIGDNNLGLVYGGGKLGLMGLVADATLSRNGRVVGIIPKHLVHKEGAHEGLTELYIVESMHIRKAQMFERADMFVVLPGGFGTLDEMFEIITWRQLNLHQKLIVVVNINGYWDHLKKLFDRVIDEGFAKEEHRSIVHFVDTPQEAIDLAKTVFSNLGEP